MGAFALSFSTLYPQEDIVMYLTSKNLPWKCKLRLRLLALGANTAVYIERKKLFRFNDREISNTENIDCSFKSWRNYLIRQIWIYIFIYQNKFTSGFDLRRTQQKPLKMYFGNDDSWLLKLQLMKSNPFVMYWCFVCGWFQKPNYWQWNSHLLMAIDKNLATI